MQAGAFGQVAAHGRLESVEFALNVALRGFASGGQQPRRQFGRVAMFELPILPGFGLQDRGDL